MVGTVAGEDGDIVGYGVGDVAAFIRNVGVQEMCRSRVSRDEVPEGAAWGGADGLGLCTFESDDGGG